MSVPCVHKPANRRGLEDAGDFLTADHKERRNAYKHGDSRSDEEREKD